MPKGSKEGKKTVTIEGSGEVEFGPWTYTEEGRYEYVIAEINTGEAGYQYDRAMYKIVDIVKDEGGVLKVYRTIENGSGKQVESITFVNIYKDTILERLKSPKTGDDSSITSYMMMLIIASLIMVSCVVSLQYRRACESFNEKMCSVKR